MYCRLAAGDGLAVVIGFSLGRLVRTDDWMTPHGVNLMVVIAVLYAAMGVITRAFALEVLDDYVESARRALIALVQAFMILFALLFAFQLGQEISRVALFMALGATLIPMLAFRYAAYVWIRRTLRSRLFDELLIVDGFDAPATPGAVRIDAALNGLSPDLDNPAMLERIALVTLFYDRVVVACTAERQNAWAVMLKSIGTTGEILLDDTNEMGAIGVGQFGGARTMIVSRGSLSMSDRAKKRMFDLAVAIPALVFLAPLLIIVAILIRLDSPGPALFRQPRVGRNNVAFSIYKFRSMRVDQADQAGARSTARDDERVSRFGRFIRRTSIDDAAAAFQRDQGGHEHRRPASARARLDRGRKAVLADLAPLLGTPRAQARNHRAGASARLSRRDRAGRRPRQPAPGRSGVSPGLAAVARYRDHPRHVARAGPPQRLLTATRQPSRSQRGPAHGRAPPLTIDRPPCRNLTLQKRDLREPGSWPIDLPLADGPGSHQRMREVMINKKSLVLLPLTLVLAACGSNSAPKGQVLATVDGEEITATDLRLELGGASAPTPDQQKALEKMALQNIVNRTLLAKAAAAEGLDKGPEFAVAERRAKQAVLIELLNAKTRKGVPAPSAEEVRTFVTNNPVMFADRRTFVVDQIVVPQVDQQLAKALQPVTSLEQARAVLAQRKIRSSTTTGVIDALTIPPEAARQIADLPPGEVFIIPSQGGLRINQVRSVQVNPIPDDQAQAIAREMLMRQRIEGQLRNRAETVIKAGAAKVKYNPEFAPPATPAGPGAAPGANPGAAPATGAPAKAG